MEQIERYRGSMMGLAVGDALGTTVEFQPPGSFMPVGDIVGGGPFDLLPGQPKESICYRADTHPMRPRGT